MESEADKPDIAADDAGIHFLRSESDGYGDPVVDWGEIEQVCALWHKGADSTTFLELFVDHFSGVDFRFHSTNTGYERVMAEMAKHLVGFSRDRAEAVGTWDEEQDLPVVWRRDEVVQPFQLHPPPVVSRDPSPEELRLMKEAHKASIATCERLLGRALKAEEQACVRTGFENGRIVGSIAFPLSETLVRRQAEHLGQTGGE